MKQSEQIAIPMGDGSAVLTESSNGWEGRKLPRLLLQTPYREGPLDQKCDYPNSMELGAKATYDLYQLLKTYYEGGQL